MAFNSTQPRGTTANKSVLIPVMTLEGHNPVTSNLPNGKQHINLYVSTVAYFPDGKQIISGSEDKTARRWDLQAGKEIEKARDLCGQEVWAVAVSGDGRWVVTSITGEASGELKACDVETGVVKTFDGHSGWITCIDISTDSTLLVSGADDSTARIWNLDTGRLVAGPFESLDALGAVRLSQNSKKLAVMSDVARYFEVWNVETQTLDVRIGKCHEAPGTYAPVFWTGQGQTIISAFSFTDDDARIIYEFNASTLGIVGAPFEGHTDTINGLALSFDYALLASASDDDTIKLWAFESRQLLASFTVQNPDRIILSPDSRQLTYTMWNETKIYICDIPSEILAIVQGARPNTSAPKDPLFADLLTSNATRRGVCRTPAISPVARPLRQLPTIYPQQPTFLRYLHKILPLRTNAVPPVQNDQPHDPLDFPAILPLPNCSPSSRATTRGRSDTANHENSRSTPLPLATQPFAAPTTFKPRLYSISTWWPARAGHASPPIVDVPLAPGKLRYATAGAPSFDDDLIRDEDFVPSAPLSPHPNSQRPSTGVQVITGQHGSGRLCGCF
ncbi:WD40 repeat-like protein [Suillus weaverae]|nr:WD40 repeat-like protein [Suillus weaverae]